MSFAINNAANEFAADEVYEVNCGHTTGVGEVHRMCKVLEIKTVDFIGRPTKIALLSDVANPKWLGIATMETESGKVSCHNARMIGQFGFDTEVEASRSLGF